MTVQRNQTKSIFANELLSFDKSERDKYKTPGK
jgi:hypothetical protein